MRLLTTYALLTVGLMVTGAFLNDGCNAQSREIMARLNKTDSAGTVFYLPANTRLNKVPWRDSVYRFKSFDAGRVTFATGFSPAEQLRMNYDLYFLKIAYISSNGDTLNITPSKELKLVSIGDHIFYHDSKAGFMEVIQQLPVALGVRQMLKVAYIDYPPGGIHRKVGYTPFEDEDLRGAAIKFDRYYMKGCDYFFIDTSNKVHNATAASVIKLFPAHKKAIKTYIDDHHVDFHNRHHLMDLLKFCNELN